MNRRLALILPAALLLAGCAAAPADDVDPLVACIDVALEYGIVDDRAAARDVCVWVRDRDEPGPLNGAGDTFDQVFSDPQLAREWARVEAGKDG